VVDLIRHCGVVTLVLSNGSNAADVIADALRGREKIHLEVITVIGAYRVLSLKIAKKDSP